ncbi:hypothetical protein BW737_000510 [Actinomyces ruminis]|uniref:Uncharacterized protein n=1 Tax=Actinomyces ruminis TaxID=1937003 RepID=A0ABX4MHR4_9ACTO|nr:hypothetical protein BW737_000510 [Actinomyces ruminis]
MGTQTFDQNALAKFTHDADSKSAVSTLIAEVLADPDLAHDDVFHRLLQAGLQDLWTPRQPLRRFLWPTGGLGAGDGPLRRPSDHRFSSQPLLPDVGSGHGRGPLCAVTTRHTYGTLKTVRDRHKEALGCEWRPADR